LEAAIQARSELKCLFEQTILPNTKSALEIAEKARIGYAYDLLLIETLLKNMGKTVISSENTNSTNRGLHPDSFAQLADIGKHYQRVRAKLQPVIRYIEKVDENTDPFYPEIQDILDPAFSFLERVMLLDDHMRHFQTIDQKQLPASANDNPASP